MKHRLLTLILLAAGLGAAHGASSLTNYRFMPSQRFRVPADSSFYPMCLNHPFPTFLKMKGDSVKSALFVNFEKKEVEIVRYYASRLSLSSVSYEDSTVPGVVLSSYVFQELDEYMDYANSLQFREDWKTGSPFFNLVEKKREAFNILDIQIPVKMPAWARRVVGSEGPRLTINGRFKLNLGGASHWQKGQNAENQKEGWPDITVGQEMAFTVTGKIGRLINVQLSTDNTQDVTDQLKKQMKIHYKGETEDELEDEIVQEVEAGYTSFSMPGSEFDGYSESNEGLFGIKVRMKLGDLQLTTIVSQEDGQVQENKFNPSKNETKREVNDRDVEFERVFFLDSLYYNYYYRNYFNTAAPQPPKIAKIYLLRLDKSLTIQQYNQNPTDYPDFRNIGEGNHKILRQFDSDKGSSEFTLDELNGTVTLRQSLSENEQLLAYFIRTDNLSSYDLGYKYLISNQDTVNGDIIIIDGKPIQPYALRPMDFDKDKPEWKLAWKNVYALGDIAEQNQNTIKIELKYKDQQGQWYDRAAISNRDSLLSDFFGLTKAGKPDISNQRVYRFADGLLALPPEFGPTPFNDTTLIKPPLQQNDKIYLYSRNEQGSQGVDNKYQFIITAVAATTTFNLGVINVLEGTEVVKSGSRTLVRDVDYLIQYDVGQITLISDEAIRSMSEITVEYQYAPFFIPEQKTFMGARLEYKLPSIGKESYVAASFLRKSETSQDKRAQLGREPTTNMLLDVNTRLNFEPGWMTDAVNRVPLISTEEKSSLTFSAEYARSIVNPNTNSRREALIDDFEDAKTLFSLQLSDAVWRWASAPDLSVIGRFDSLQCWGGNLRGEGGKLSDVGWFSWYTRDTTQVSIWEGSANRQARWRILQVEMEPHKRKQGAENAGAADDWFRKGSWGGFMAPLGLGVKNQLTTAQYLEIVVYVGNTRDKGFLHIDLGKLSEDLRIRPQDENDTSSTSIMIVNAPSDRRFNDEWWDGSTSMTVKNDLGLDMRGDADELFFAPVQCNSGICFETITPDKCSDPAGDNYDWKVGETDFRAFNGTQNNATGEYADVRKQYSPDNEDVFNSNGQVDTRSSYYHYWIDLNKTDSRDEPYYETSTTTGWRLYKIPLTQRKITGVPAQDAIPFKIGSPLLTEATGIRIWMDSLTEKTTLQIAKVEIVGNKWTSRDSAKILDSSGTRSGKKLNVSVVNTVDNPEYSRPSFIPDLYDDEQDVKVKEQALLLEYDSLTRLDPEAQAVYTTQLAMDFRLYQKLLLYYRPISIGKGEVDDASPNVEFHLRFGSDSLNYYEYYLFPSNPGTWDSIRIDLKEIAQLKQAKKEELAGSQEKLYATDHRHLRVVGYPTFAEVKWMALGFKVDTSKIRTGDDVYWGRFWLNDLKLIEPEELSGNAARVTLNTRFADLIDFNTGVYYRDGSFMRLTEKRMGGGESEMSTDMSSTLQLQKFTPAKWGLSLPLSGAIKSSIRRPRFFPNSDVRLSDDGLGQMAPDLVNLMTGSSILAAEETDSRRYEATTVSKSLTSSYRKSVASDNLALNLTADRITTSGGYSVTDSRDMQSQKKDYSINNNVNYRATMDKEPSVTPFVNSQGQFMRDHLSDMKLFYYPKGLDFKVYDTRYTKSYSWTRRFQATDAPLKDMSEAYGLSMSHSYDLKLDLMQWKHLNMGLTQNNSVERNLGDAVTREKGFKSDMIGDYVLAYNDSFELRKGLGFLPRRYVLYGETGNSQNFTYYFEPSVIDWLKHDFDYSSNYSHSVNLQKINNRQVDYLNMSLDNRLGADFSWKFLDMFSQGFGLFYKDKEKTPFKSVKAVFDYLNFNTIGVNYGVDVKRKVSNLDDVPLTPGQYLAFRSGFYGQNPYNLFTGRDDETLFGGWKFPDKNRGAYAEGLGASTSDKRDVNRTASTSMGLTLPFLLNMNLNTSLSYGESYSEIVNQITVDTVYTWPSVKVSGSLPDLMPVLRAVPFLSERINRTSASSSFGYDRTLGVKFQTNVPSKRWEEYSINYSLSPLLRMDVELKNRVTLSNDITWSLMRKFTLEERPGNEGTEDYKLADKVSAAYTIQKNKTFKLLFWDITMNNQLSLNAHYGYTLDWSYKWPVEGKYESYDDYAEAAKVKEPQHFKKAKSWDYGAGAAYNITNKMKAGGEVSYKKAANDIPPGGDENSTDTKLDYNIIVNFWVEWTF